MDWVLPSKSPSPSTARVDLADDRPRYLGWVSMVMIAALVWANAALTFDPSGPLRDNLTQQLVVHSLFCLGWFGWVGLRISNAVFAVVALLPAVLVGGYGVLFLPGAALAPSDLMTLVVIALWLGRRPRLRWRGYSQRAAALFVVCAGSALLALDIGFVGAVVRLMLAVWLVLIVFSEQGQRLRRALVHGLLLWPVTTLAYLGGIESLWRFFSFGDGRALDAYSTNESLFGAHVVIMHLLLLVPLAVYAGRQWLVLPLLIALTPYVLFSLNRSLIFAVGLTCWFIRGCRHGPEGG